MTIAGRRSAVTKGSAKLLVRIVRSSTGPRPDWRSFYKPEIKHQQVFVEFNTKDELELQCATSDKEENTKNNIGGNGNKENINTINALDGKSMKVENFKIDEIIDCTANETNDFINTLILETVKKNVREEIVLKFAGEQECRRTLFTYKYFKMRNRLSSSSTNESSDGSSSPSLSTKSRSSVSSNDTGSNIGNYVTKTFDYTTNQNVSHYIKNYGSNSESKAMQNFGTKSLDYISLNHLSKNRQNFETKIKDINTKNNKNNKTDTEINNNNTIKDSLKSDDKGIGEIDGLIYTDIEYESMDYPSMNYAGGNSRNVIVDVPLKPQRRKQHLRRIKGKAPPPPGGGAEVVRGQVVKVGVDRGEKVPTKDSDSVTTRITVPRTHNGVSGYESDREEWRSRSTFSSSAFHSLARPARRALAAYYRLSSSPPIPAAQQLLVKPSPRNPRNLQEYPKNFIAPNPEYVILSQIQDNKRANFSSNFQTADFNKNSFQKQELKYGQLLFNQDYKRNTLGGSMNYLNLSHRLYGITDKIKEIGQPNNTKPNWIQKPEKEKREKGQLKPVIKKNITQEGSKRPVVRTCSAEPPKKVTFSAFATVQVV